MYKTGETVVADFTTQTPSTGAATNADSLPTAVLVLNGVDNGATVTVTNKATGVYKASVVLPAVTDGDTLQIRVAAVVGGVTGKAVIWEGEGTAKRVAALNDYAGGDTAGTTTLLARLSAARAGYLDNLNVGGAVASQADVLAINQSASKHVILATVGQYERPESGTVTYTVEARTFAAATGAAVNADSTPTLTATGSVSGSLAANLSAATNPATGVYRWTYTVSSTDALEQVRFDVSATIAAATFTLSAYTQVADFVAATFTTADRTLLTNTNTRVLLALPASAPDANGGLPKVTQVLTIKTLQYTVDQATNVSTVNGIVGSAANTIADALLDRTDGVEVGVTPRQYFQRTGAVLAGVNTGAGTGTEKYNAIGNPGTLRNTYTVDINGNRSVVTFN